MRTKTFLFATTFAMMAACMMMNSSCTKYVDEAAENGGSRQAIGKATVKLRFTSPEGADVSVSQSARPLTQDRKSTRLNSSHRAPSISYAVFCLDRKSVV